MPDVDSAVRLAAFEWLRSQQDTHGDVLPRSLLAAGFSFDGQRVPLLGPQGIFKPRVLDLPLSITTVPDGPYNDTFEGEDYLLYKYRGTDPFHRDNAGLRTLMKKSIPLIYFHGLSPGRYLSIWPIYIVGDNPADLSFRVVADDPQVLSQVHPAFAPASDDARRSYITTTVQRRVHQRSFRERVLRAYRERCSVCRLGHYPLLDAAHIIGDTEPEGIPSVQNGIALCKLHHAAFDSRYLGITPDYEVQIRASLLYEKDGPMLQHGLKELHGSKLILPSDRSAWPDRDRLATRYEQFKEAS